MGLSVGEFRKLIEKANGGKSAPSEHDLQVTCVNLFRAKHYEHAHLLFAIPNGGYRCKRTASMMRAEGQQSGVPDLFLAVARHGYHGLWIEMKNGKAGRVSKEQKEMMEVLEEQGYKCEVCRSVEDFDNVTDTYLQ